MGEFLAFPSPRLAREVRDKRLLFRQALGEIGVESATELARVERARAANDELMAIFNDQPALSGGAADDRGARRLHTAEWFVLRPIEQLRAGNRRDNLRAETVADSAEPAAFHSELATALLGLAAVA